MITLAELTELIRMVQLPTGWHLVDQDDEGASVRVVTINPDAGSFEWKIRRRQSDGACRLADPVTCSMSFELAAANSCWAVFAKAISHAMLAATMPEDA